ncbi:hypothetical protein XENTR_v10000232 [Xenopus tropicalis]|nr:hypothetical protein XENTR_v10000232 [Xenopus tropicalis]
MIYFMVISSAIFNVYDYYYFISFGLFSTTLVKQKIVCGSDISMAACLLRSLVILSRNGSFFHYYWS